MCFLTKEISKEIQKKMKVVLKKMRAFSAGAAVKIGAGYFRAKMGGSFCKVSGNSGPLKFRFTALARFHRPSSSFSGEV